MRYDEAEQRLIPEVSDRVHMEQLKGTERFDRRTDVLVDEPSVDGMMSLDPICFSHGQTVHDTIREINRRGYRICDTGRVTVRVVGGRTTDGTYPVRLEGDGWAS